MPMATCHASRMRPCSAWLAGCPSIISRLRQVSTFLPEVYIQLRTGEVRLAAARTKSSAVRTRKDAMLKAIDHRGIRSRCFLLSGAMRKITLTSRRATTSSTLVLAVITGQRPRRVRIPLRHS